MRFRETINEIEKFMSDELKALLARIATIVRGNQGDPAVAKSISDIQAQLKADELDKAELHTALNAVIAQLEVLPPVEPVPALTPPAA